WLGLALICMGAAMVLWLLVLQTLPVGIAYPMLSLNFVWVTLAGRKISITPAIMHNTPSIAFRLKAPCKPGNSIEATQTST
ncbi:hypothetical protein KU626_23860, partial [Salmonella enterica subsp. enterica serovar Mbandaka]|nr:hypothetical protein [Salmonella enterica subsp. enterica serovar Mbandaka]